MRVSILDRSRTRLGASDAEAIARTIERAERAERLGLHRFWVAEHHSVPGIASAAPTVLLAAIGARTRTIRLGTGGIMLPNHNPLVVAEQVRLLEALHPRRIDVGIGASLGFTSSVRRALGRTTFRADEHAAAVEQLRSYLHGDDEVVARPDTAAPPVFLLAVKNGLTLAAELGLPAVVGGPLLVDTDAIAAYFRDYRPSPAAPDPYLVASVDVAVADSAERARHLLLPEIWALASSRESGAFTALLPVDEARRKLDESGSPRVRAAVEKSYDTVIAGTPDQVAAKVGELMARTGAAEVLATTNTFDHGDLADLDEALAALQG
ncbi:MsnO8 family LLM class oxidoreductase [Myceligenerans pegani]|uniref:MsnO8 family LLM class oxidoreductase n=1 Tax=Myceligenerans pegani TaxID=2776917 RepID=A0ABR9N097_9MICO|nr:MsnO8 family LLM class oxidoreductase [Myceligenerans sp. TRM 65318]MBE1876666.1 MsnO8 family LLM class oxidoreductase [Myceligenerans sp. TRM 65318]MBE3018937.1 MsnO8 family LLM class oxidoreductase [Myceligenerans sp. TRM 65318]